MTESRAREIHAALREVLDLPDDWIELTQMQGRPGYVVGVALNMHAEDFGDGESGPSVSIWPSRWVEVYGHDGNEDFELFEGDDDDPDAGISILCPAGDVVKELLDHIAEDPQFKIETGVQS